MKGPRKREASQPATDPNLDFRATEKEEKYMLESILFYVSLTF